MQMNKHVKYFSFLLLFLVITGTVSFAQTNDPCKTIKFKDNFVTWGFKEHSGKRNVDVVVIHSSYNALNDDIFSVEGVIEEYRMYKVSPHYLIDREGVVHILVDEDNIAYHAGKSALSNGRTNLNSCSIGIEIINSPKFPPSEAQYNALANLIKCIKDKYNINYVVTHSEIAPGRKDDPWLFDRNKLDLLLKK